MSDRLRYMILGLFGVYVWTELYFYDSKKKLITAGWRNGENMH